MIDIIFIAVVQIIVEALPISSSGHVALVKLLWAKCTGHAVAAVPEFFDYFLHGPTLAIIVMVFFHDWRGFIRLLPAWANWAFFRRPLRWSERVLSMLFFRAVGFMCAATVIMIGAYGIKSIFAGSESALGGRFFLLFNMSLTMCALLSLRWAKPRHTSLHLRAALGVGLAQACAFLLTGLSRFGATYVAGRWFGLSPRRSFQFSFLIQVPLIVAAFFFKGLPGMIKVGGVLCSWQVLVACGVAAGVAGIAFAWAYRCALQERLWVFGLYMMLPISVLLFFSFC